MFFTLIAIYDQGTNTTALVYLAIPSTYSLRWLIKSRFFLDKKWERKTSLWYGILISGGLSLYCVAPWIIVYQGVKTPNWYLAVCISIYTFCVFLQFSSDIQKYVSLKLQPNKLITQGFWGLERNPNYLGELLIYGGFGLLAMHLFPMGILLLWTIAIWVPYMRMKDFSLSRYPGFEEYKSRTN